MEQKILHDDWEYLKDEKGNMSIIPSEKDRRQLPETLFKYYELNEYSLESLENHEIYASHPNQLNDPFDTVSDLVSFDHVESIGTILSESIKEEPVIRERFIEEPLSLGNLAEQSHTIQLYSKLGIFCLTEDPNNMLMWAYYTNHQGFCVEYDYSSFSFPFHGPFQMKYQEKFQILSIRNGAHVCMLYQSNIKSIEWSHEKEWRILPEKRGGTLESKGYDFLKDQKGVVPRTFPLENKPVKRIILGLNFFDTKNEMTRSDDSTMLLELKTNVDKKNRLLDHIIEGDVPVSYSLKKPLMFGLYHVNVKITRFDELKLKMVINMNDLNEKLKSFQ